MAPLGDERMTAGRGHRLKAVASSILRDWAWQTIEAIAADVGAVGRSAGEAATREIARLPKHEANMETDGLARLAIVIEAIGQPPPRRWSPFRSRATRGPTQLSDIVAVIECERDALLRRLTTLDRDRLRLEAAHAAYEEALELLDLLETGIAAVSREVAPQAPAQATMLRTEVVEVLTERRCDLGLQLLVLRQAVATHDLVADGQKALAGALDRARKVTVGAAQTAIAARGAAGADPISNDGFGTGSMPLTDAIARLHAVLDHRERG